MAGDSFTVSGKLEIDAEKAKRGVVELDAQIKTMARRAKEAAQETQEAAAKAADEAAKASAKAAREAKKAAQEAVEAAGKAAGEEAKAAAQTAAEAALETAKAADAAAAAMKETAARTADALEEYERQLRNAAAAEEAGAKTAREAAAQKLDAANAYIDALVRQKEAMREAGVSGGKAVQASIDGLVERRKELEKNIEAAKKLEKADKEIGKLQSALKSMGPLGVKLGDGIGKAMGGPAANGFRAAATAAAGLQAAMGPILVVVGLIAAAVKLIGAAVRKAAAEQREFAENAESAKKALDGVKNAADGAGGSAEKAAKKAGGVERSGAAARIAFEKLGGFIKNVLRPAVEALLVPFNAVGDAITWVAKKLKLVTEEELQIALEAQAVADQTKGISEATERYQDALEAANRNLELGRITQAEADEEKLNAQNDYLDALLEQRRLMMKKDEIDGNSAIIRQLDAQIARMAEQTGLMNGQKEAKKRELTFEEKRDEIIAEMNRKLAYQNELNLSAKDLQEAQNQIRQAALGQLDALYAKEEAARESHARSFELYDGIKGAIAETAKAELTFIEKRDEIIKEMNRNLAYQNELNLEAKDLQEAQNRIREQALGQLDALYAKEEAARESHARSFEIYDGIKGAIVKINDEKKKEITLEEIAQKNEAAKAKARADYNAAVAAGIDRKEAEKKLAEDISAANMAAAEAAFLTAENLERGTPAWRAAQKAAEGYAAAVARIEKKLSKTDIAGRIADTAGQAAQNALAATQRMGEDQIESVQKTLEAMRAAVDAEFDRSMKLYEEQRQAALEAAGFAAAVTEEGLEAAMAAAEATLDQQAVDREKRRQEQLAINKKYDDLEAEARQKKEAQAEAAEKKAAREIADIRFAQATADWTLKLSQLPAQMAAGIAATVAQLGPVVGGPLATAAAAALGASQAAAMLAAMPKKPTFAFANGAAFAGAVVDRPTRFAFAQGGEFRRGLMGEAGPEAVVPLERMADGALGVNASGAGGGEYATLESLAGFLVKLYNDGHGDMIEGRRVRL